MASYKGIMSALVTPLTADRQVDEAKLRELVDIQIKGGVHSLLALGGTGEYAALTNRQRAEVVRITIEQTNKRVPVVAGILSAGIGDCIEIGEIFKGQGVDAVLALTPYYVTPSQDGIIEYYKALDKALQIKMMIYNIPYRTMVNMVPESVEKCCAAIPNMIGIKECCPDFPQSIDLIRRMKDKIYVLSGEEFLAPSQFVLGFDGAVMATSNIVPETWVKIWDLVQEGKVDEALTISKKHYPLFKAIFAEVNPGPLKWAMNNLYGYPGGELSLPLLNPSEATIQKLKDAFKEVNS